MMTSSNGNIFRVTDHLCGEFLVNSPHKGQWRGALMFSMVCALINSWVNNREVGDLRRHRTHYDVIVMSIFYCNSLPQNIMSQSTDGSDFLFCRLLWSTTISTILSTARDAYIDSINTRRITWCRGRATIDGNTALGASSPAKPALHIPEPLSTTKAWISSL